MRKILIYIKDYKKESVFGPLFKLLEASFELIVPLIVASIIDKGILLSDKMYIFSRCFVLILLATIGFACSITAQYFSAKAACGFGSKLRHALFDKIQSLSFSELDNIGAGTLITRMTSDVNQIQTTVNLVLRLFLRSPFIVFGAMIMAFTIDFKIALIFVATIPVLSIVVFGIMLGSIPLYKKVQAALDKITTLTSENLEGIRVIRAFCSEKDEIKKYNIATDDLNKIQKLSGKISALLNPVTYVIINAAIVLLIYTGAIRVNNGIISQGMVVALYNYMAQILVELIKLANFIINITKATACGARIEKILETEPSIKDGNLSKKNCFELADDTNAFRVEFKDVTLNYGKSGEPALKNISFDVKPGETIGIIGATGSGKTSFVNLIPRFYDATSGTVKVDGVDVKDYKLNDLRNKIGIAMQKNILFKGTIFENLLWGNPNATDEEINNAIDTAQARDIIDSKEDGLNSVVEQGGMNFSGGQKQRLTIARALVRNPEILILDDSASALDYATDAALRASIKKLPKSPTVFIVSQRTASIAHADKIIVLDNGEICATGTHKSLLKECEIYKEIYVSQI